ncbi:MAG: PAS domain S-box protein [Anaerolineae bacterium]
MGVFLVDEARVQRQYSRANSEADGFGFKATSAQELEESMIGWSIYHREARIALDVGKEAVRFKNPDLPKTRSEMALPLIYHREAIGALTIQSEEPAAFRSEDILVLKTVADQLANAVKNAQLYAQAQAEILQRKQIAEELQASEAKYRELVQNANSIIFRMNTEGRIIFFNEFAQRFFGYTAEEIIGQKVIGAIVPETDTAGQDLVAMIQGILQQPEQYSANENENIRRDGSRVWVAWTNKSILDENGQISEVLCIGNDITGRKRAEAALRDSEELYQSLVNNLSQSIFRKDIAGRFTFGNNIFCQNMGLSLEELIGKTDYDICPPELAEIYRQNDQKVIASGQPLEVIEEHQPVGKDKILVRAVKSPTYDSAGNINGIQAIFWDITERQQIERALRTSEERYRTIFEQSRDMIYITAREGEFLAVNQAGLDLFGYTHDEMIGLNIAEVYTNPAERLTFQQEIEQKGSLKDYEIKFHHKNGAKMDCLVSATLWQDQEGHILGYQGIMRDITQQKRITVTLTTQARLAAFSAEVGLALTQSSHQREALQRCTEAMVQHLDATFARVWIFNPVENMLELQASAGLYTHLDGPHGRVPLGKFKIGLIAQEKRPHLTNTVLGDPRVGDQEWAKREGMVAFAGYPLLIEDRLVGVMAMFARQPLNEDIFQAMETVATSMALAIERTRIEERLKASQALLQAIIDNSTAPIYVIDTQGRFLLVNNQFCALFGLSKEAVIGKTDYDIFDISTAEDYQSVDLEVLESGKVVQTEEAVSVGQETRTFVTLKFPLYDEFGVPYALCGISTDITERKKAEQALQESLQRTQLLYNITEALATMTDQQAAFETVLGEYLLLLKVGRGGVMLLDPASGYNKLIALYIDNKIVEANLLFPAEEDLIAQFLTENPFSLVIEDINTHPLTQHNRDIRGQVESMLLAPIVTRGRVVGILGADATQPGHVFSQEDIAIGEAVADQVAVWLDNHQLLTEAQHSSTLLMTAAEVSQAASSILDVGQLINTAVNLIRDKFNLYYVGLFLVDEAREWAVLRAGTGEAGQIQLAKQHRLQIGGESMIGWCIEHQQARIALDVGKEAVRFQNPVLPLTRSEMALPLLSREAAIGALTVQSDKANAFSREDVALLQSMADHLANAIENAHLFEETVRARTENAQLFQLTQTALAETQKLYDISRSLAESTDLNEVYEIVIENVKAYEIDRVSISLVEKNEQGQIDGVVIAASWDNESDKILPVGTKISAKIFSLVNAFAHPPFHPLISEDLRYPEGQDERLDEVFRLFMAEGLGAVTLFSAPMFLGAVYKGVLSVSTRSPHAYTKEEARIYQTLADQAIIAIENQRLLTATQQSLHHSQILSHLSQELLVADTKETIYNLTLEAIAITSPDRGAAIFVYDQQEGRVDLEMVGLWNNPRQGWPEIGLGARFSVSELGLEPLLKTGRTVSSITAPVDPQFSAMLRQLLLMMQINSLVAVPVWLNREVSGFVLVGNQEAVPFAPELVRLYEDIGRQLSGALENRRLFDEAEYRASLLQTAAEVSQVATSSLNLETLLPQTAELIRNRFNFYHVSLYLIDAYQKYAVIEASTGSQPLSAKHRLKVGGKSAVGIAASTGKADQMIGQETAPHASSLPQNLSEIALPLRARGQIIGALDVHKIQVGAFSDNDVTVLQSLADQLANAIEAARAYQASRQALADTNKLQEYYLREQWSAFLKEQKVAGGYQLTEQGFFTDTENKPIDFNGARHPVVLPAAAYNTLASDTSTVVTPLMLHEAVIGALSFELPPQSHLGEDELHIVEAVAGQATQALEAIRLFEQTQVAREEAEALYRVGRTLVATEDEQEMLEAVLGTMLSILGLEQGGILFIEKDGKFGTLHALFEQGRPVAPGLRFPIAGNLSYEKLIETKRPVVIEDVTTDPLVAVVREMNLARGLVSLLLVPIIINDQVVGALGADSVGHKHYFTEREINLASAMADQLSITLENRRLLEEAKQRAVQLQKTAERLKEIDKLKTQFLANMSHELRTPLNSIIGFSRVILKGIDGPLTELQKTDLTSIHNSGQHLLSLINNILDLSKIEAGKMELNFEKVDLGPIIKGVMSTAIALVKEKPVKLKQEAPADLPLVWADPTRMRQVILNLVSNACKFTDEGEVMISVEADANKVIIRVSDTGIGIPEDKLESIFEEFTQVDASTTRKVGGTGLGLPISRHFVEMHHGEIWVESKLGCGSTFSFCIPLNPSTVESENSVGAPLNLESKTDKVVVAIDNDAAVITMYEQLLERQDYQVVGLSQNHDILAQIKVLTPSAILLDVRLPGRDGWGILNDLKKDPYTKDIPVIICSTIDDKHRGFTSGAADYLLKPVTKQELVKALKHVTPTAQERIKVLVIDDHADDILLIRRIFEAQTNYKIIEASSGKQGLELAHTVNPDLVILDLTMPEMDGFSVVEALKHNEKTHSIPIIVVSAKELNLAEQNLLTGQVEVLLRKGIFTENELLEDVSQALNRFPQHHHP